MLKIFKNRGELSWMFYDWANSAFATTVMAGFFPIFFKSYWSATDSINVSTAKLAFANSMAGLIIAVMAPLLGAVADRSGSKQKFLMSFTFIGSIGCLSLGFIAQGHWEYAILSYIIASLGFFSSNIFYDSLLTDVADSESEYDRVSSGGFALGYLGGGLLFAMNVWWTLKPEFFGFEEKIAAVKASFISVALWWSFFSIPLLWTKLHKVKSSASVSETIKGALLQLRHTFQEIKHIKVLFTFLLAYWLYIDGVDTIIRMATDYGLSLGFKQTDLISALLMIQFLGFPFTYIFGFLTAKTSRKTMIYFGIFIYMVICIWAFFMKNRWEFYSIAFLVSMAQGGIQAISRGYFATLIPPQKSAEYFGFYNMLGKFAVIAGPVLMGVTNLLAGYFTNDAVLAARYGILSVLLLFILGALILSKVDDSVAQKEKKYL